MSEYAPSLNEIRADYVRDHTRNFDSYMVGRSLTSEQEFYGEQFDSALAEHDRQVAERAWDEGFDRGFYSGQAMRSDADASESTVENPHRAKGGQKGEPSSDDEREALARAIRNGSGASRYQADLLAGQILPHLAGFRRPEVPEPSAEEKDAGLSDAHSESYRQGWRAGRASAHSEPQGEPSDAPTVQFVARKGQKSQALIDQMLKQANEHGIRVEVIYPQGEPSDAEVIAAMNDLNGYEPPVTDISYWSAGYVDAMRAALRAAAEVRGEIES